MGRPGRATAAGRLPVPRGPPSPAPSLPAAGRGGARGSMGGAAPPDLFPSRSRSGRPAVGAAPAPAPRPRPSACRAPACGPRSAALSSAPRGSGPSPVSGRAARKVAAAPGLARSLFTNPGDGRGPREGRSLRRRRAGGGGAMDALGLPRALCAPGSGERWRRQSWAGTRDTGDSPAAPRDVTYTRQRNPLCRAPLFPSVQ